MKQPDLASQKAKDLVRMAVAKAFYLQPLKEERLNIAPRALIVGGGISGMAAARAISRQGFPAGIIERDNQLGGQARHLYRTTKGDNIQQKLDNLIDEVSNDPNITVYLNSKLEKVEGFVGNFRSTVDVAGKTLIIDHGVTVIASGAQEFQPDEYLFGKDHRVIRGLEMDRRLKQKDPDLNQIQRAVFIGCVGSREPHRPYCSRICCTHSVAAALHLKEINPSLDVYILYRDVRTYGEREGLYKRAREKGVIFIRFDLDHKPKVRSTHGELEIEVVDHILQRPVVLQTDLLTLATAVIPYKDEHFPTC
jgi:heterodisulfide reductase subunit A2